ncbi:MAG TPA: TetR/AcrR family transcriptional regulator, partial [Polyangiaceae bacterium]
GLAKRTLYNHFESKERLFDTTVAVLCEEGLAFLFARYDEADLLPRPENIRAAVRAFFDYSAAHPDGRALLLSTRTPTPGAARMIQETKDKLTARIAQSFRQRRGPKGDPVSRVAAVMAAMTVGAADYVAREVSRSDDWDMDAVVMLVAEVWAQGISHVSLDLLARADTPTKTRARRS